MQLVGEKISQELLKIFNLCNMEDVTKHVIAKVIACTYSRCVAWWLKEKVKYPQGLTLEVCIVVPYLDGFVDV